MASRGEPGRTLRRRFTLGSGPLKRASDRAEFASRVVLALALLLAVPLGLLAGAMASTAVTAVEQQQAATRTMETATLLADAGNGGSDAVTVPTSARWTAPDGGARTGDVEARPGARAGSTVDIWVDADGRRTERPLTDGEVVGQAVVIGVLVGLGVVIAGMTSHLVVVWLLERGRVRGWEKGWASVEPLWVSRFR
ncbi:Rv1733c family protein [Petropleomorpha daqingensis]|uniref:Uncharacterized protein n=1 Tax=Petropleomorpha daqingensis TaxID=2026353 RepID=A0A853CLZ6_9ACTN|nr:hypothetical protein [Petropleomorpha daqingensis]NYJ08760.1 hypothetical protein [Petropleomorpha daqingensis]